MVILDKGIRLMNPGFIFLRWVMTHLIRVDKAIFTIQPLYIYLVGDKLEYSSGVSVNEREISN